MPEDHINPQPSHDENAERQESAENTERFESDTQKLVRKHLEDKDHVITDEDIANVRVGMVPPEFDTATEARFEGEESRENVEENLLGNQDEDTDENLDDKRITPWDAIDPAK